MPWSTSEPYAGVRSTSKRRNGALRRLPRSMKYTRLANVRRRRDAEQKTAYEIMPSLVGSEMCIRDRTRAA